MFRRRVLALAVIGVWLSVVGWHVRREYFRPELAVLAEGARGLAPGTYFYAVRMGDAVIGTAGTRLDTLADGFLYEDNILLDVPALDTVQRAVVRTSALLSRVLMIRRFGYRMDSDIGTFGVTGTALGDSALALEVAAGSEAQHHTLRTAPGLSLDPLVPIRLAAAGQLKPGHSARARILDPSALEEREISLAVTATDTLIVPDSARFTVDGRWVAQAFDTIPVWRVEQSFGGVAVASWVDEDGMLVRAESPLGFTIERTAYELATQEHADSRGRADLAAGYGAIIEGTAVQSNVVLRDATERERLAVRLGGVELAGFDLAGGRQRLQGDTLVVQREAPAELEDAGYDLPFQGAGEPARELASTPLIQSRDERIEREARRIVRRTRDPVRAARRLNEWVYQELRKEVVPSVPSAVQVLEARRGDCNEHTVLFVALARAVGLPARTAVGLVHLNGRFYYHAWPEVWLGGRWVAVDPTLGQFPADASHLRFLVGGLARQVELIRLIGRLQLDVV